MNVQEMTLGRSWLPEHGEKLVARSDIGHEHDQVLEMPVWRKKSRAMCRVCKGCEESDEVR